MEHQLTDFFPTLGAVLCANLLTVMFVWAGLNISRREQRQESVGVYIVGLITPLAFAGLILYSTFFER